MNGKDFKRVNQRDKYIDRLRGLAMLWVIVVHVLYWGDFFRNEYFNLTKSFCLFEMPLFFFVTGASHSFSKVTRYFRFVGKRFLRLLIPYWVFAVICAVLSIVKYSLEDTLDLFTAVKVLLSWLVPIDRQMTSIPYLTWALWFVPVYLCIVLVIPVLKHMKQSPRKVPFAFLLLGVFAVTCLLKIGWVQNIAFYSFWTYAGLFYHDIKLAAEQKHTKKYFLYTTIAGVVVLCFLRFTGQSLDMQSNKFPPNIVFLVFSITMMALILLAISHFDTLFGRMENRKLVGKMFSLFSTRSMTIFLYQVFAFHLTIGFVNMLIPGNDLMASIAKSLLCLAATIPVCAGFAALFGKIETLKRKHNGSNL